jgi:hypothetical protein
MNGTLRRRGAGMTGALLFGLSPRLCGFAWTAGVLIAAPAGQGVPVAVMVPSALPLLVNTFEEGHERNQALAVWSGSGSLGWRWVFFLNVPVAVLLLGLTPVLLRESRTACRGPLIRPGRPPHRHRRAAGLRVRRRRGPPGMAGCRPGLSSCLMAAAALAALYSRVEARSADPRVPRALLRSRSVGGANLVIFGRSDRRAAGRGRRAAAGRCGERAADRGAGGRRVRPDLLRGPVVSDPGSAPARSPVTAALTGVGNRSRGVASGINTAGFQTGGACEVAVATSVAVSSMSGPDRLTALTAGYRAAFTACVVLALAGVVCPLPLVVLRGRPAAPRPKPDVPVTARRARS